MNRNGAAQQKSYREKPSTLRDELCTKLWEKVCEHEPTRARIEREMCDTRDARLVEGV